jgi:hypothetical protein
MTDYNQRYSYGKDFNLRSLTYIYFNKILDPTAKSTWIKLLITQLRKCISHLNSLFQSSSHNFISPHFYIKSLNMPTLITQDEFEETILPNPRLTMALPYLAPMVIPLQVPKNKVIQIGLWGRAVVPAPGPPPIQVGEHTRGGRKVEAHKRKVAVKSKATKSKKKTGKAKHSAFHNGQNDCKESVNLARTLYFQELRNLVKKN